MIQIGSLAAAGIADLALLVGLRKMLTDMKSSLTRLNRPRLPWEREPGA